MYRRFENYIRVFQKKLDFFMNVQEIIVGILIMASIAWLARRIYRTIRQIRDKNAPTCGCGCDECPLAKKCQNEKK